MHHLAEIKITNKIPGRQIFPTNSPLKQHKNIHLKIKTIIQRTKNAPQQDVNTH